MPPFVQKREEKKTTKRKASTRKIFKTVEEGHWMRVFLEKLRLIVNGPAMDDTL